MAAILRNQWFCGLLLTLATGLGPGTPPLAATIHVPSAQPTIQAGIDAASAGDTVLVAAGTYAGNGNREINFGGREIAVRSAAGAAATIVDCESLGRGFLFQNQETAAASLEGFTITNGEVADRGAGILCTAASPTISRCALTRNVASGGAGMSCEDGSAPLVTGCVFAENGAGAGGGLLVDSGSAPVVIDCAFNHNDGWGQSGGAIEIIDADSAMRLEDCVFTANAAEEGGAIHGTPPVIADCTFVGNHGLDHGGAIHGGASLVTGMQVERCVFVDNIAWQGAAVYSSGKFIDCTFAGNGPYAIHSYYDTLSLVSCTFTEGGLYAEGGTFTVDQCEFTGNTSSNEGGAIYALFSSGEIANSQFSHNVAREGGAIWSTGDLLIRDCEFDDNRTVGSFGQSGGGAIAGSVTVQDCIFRRNLALPGTGGPSRGGAIWGSGSYDGCRFIANRAETGSIASEGGAIHGEPVVSHCTFFANSADHGAALTAGTIDRSIIAFNVLGEAVSGCATLTCTDIVGNEGGDWVGCIADQLGVNGNFSADPIFCDSVAENLHLDAASPCAPEHSPAGCDLLGALPVGCDVAGVATSTTPAARLGLSVYPNPVRTDGVIEWTDADGQAADLRLYDALGRLIAGRDGVGGGRQRVTWRGIVGARMLAAGVYFLELRSAAGSRATARVILTR